MTRYLAGLVLVTALATQLPAEGFDHQDAHDRAEIATMQAIRERVRERVQHRLRRWYEGKLAELTPDPVIPEPVAPEPAPTYSGGVLSAAQVASYARGAGFPESVIPTMVSIAYRESRFDPGAINSSSGACGLWQLYPCPGPDALDPARNAALAYSKYQSSGLSPWAL